MSTGADINDVNDFLKEHGPTKLADALDRHEPWLVPGLSGKAGDDGEQLYLGKAPPVPPDPRLHLVLAVPGQG